mmetsp:Transcript_35892/g.78605  ORF Transcript_35892/g.78605 Transcript_35892/m.78605 type:complete len:482 (-) Transcript_35892:100-1545(-)
MEPCASEGAQTEILAGPALDPGTELARCAPLPHEIARMQRCIRELEETMRHHGADWLVQPFGSFANGFGTRGSDLDITISHVSWPSCLDGLFAAGELSWRLQPLLQQHPSFEVVQEIYMAKVPILKLRFENCLEVDISCSNLQALRNTRLLLAYSSMGGLVQDFVMAVKLWAKAFEVCGAASRNLSSYTFTLMAIYFLQVDPEIHLPCIPVGAFEEGGLGAADPRVEAAKKEWAPQEKSFSAMDLFHRFRLFFAEEFGWGSEVVSVRLGRRESAASPEFGLMQHRLAKRIHVEDPYELGRNLHCVLSLEREAFLRTTFSTPLGAWTPSVPDLDEDQHHGGAGDSLSQELAAAKGPGTALGPASAASTASSDGDGVESSGSGAQRPGRWSEKLQEAETDGVEVTSLSRGRCWWKHLGVAGVQNAVSQVLEMASVEKAAAAKDGKAEDPPPSAKPPGPKVRPLRPTAKARAPRRRPRHRGCVQ